MIPVANLTYLWDVLVTPRLGCDYVWGGSFDANDPTVGTDCLAEGTLVTTARGEIPIEELTTRDLVLTRQGYRRVLRAWKVREDAPVAVLTVKGRTLCGTADHRVWTENRGWVGLGSVVGTDTVVLCQESSELSSRATPIADTLIPHGRPSVPTSSASPRMEKAPRHYTGRSGSITTVLSRPATKSTTRITTPSIMIHRTLPASRPPSIAERARLTGDCMTMFAPSAGPSSRRIAHHLVPAGSAASDTSTTTTTVYDVSVEGAHEFFANGILVHNCSGAVSAALCALEFGPSGMIWPRQFWTGTFAGATPGDQGPFDGVDCTSNLVCIARPEDAPFGAAMIIAVRQESDPTDAHTICSVPTSVGGPWTTIEMGGPPDNYHLNVTAIDDPEFNQWFYLPGPIGGGAPIVTNRDRYIVAIINTGQRLGITPKGITIALATAIVESGLQMYANSNEPDSLNLPHDAVGSDHLSEGLFQQQPPWGSLTCRMDAACSAELFFTVDNGPGVRGLTKIRDDSGALYDYNSDDNTPGEYAEKVQGSAYPDRYDQHWDEASALYAQYVGSSGQGGFLMALTDQQQQEIYDKITTIWDSRSPFRHLGEHHRDDTVGFILNTDSNVHTTVITLLAAYGDPVSLSQLREVAAADPTQFPDRQSDAALARLVLSRISGTPTPAPTPAPAPSPTPTPVPTSNPTNKLTDDQQQVAREVENKIIAQVQAVAPHLIDEILGALNRAQ